MSLYDGPLLPLIIKPYTGNYMVGQTLIDSGSGLNLLFANTYVTWDYLGSASFWSRHLSMGLPLEKARTRGPNS